MMSTVLAASPSNYYAVKIPIMPYVKDYEIMQSVAMKIPPLSITALISNEDESNMSIFVNEFNSFCLLLREGVVIRDHHLCSKPMVAVFTISNVFPTVLNDKIAEVFSKYGKVIDVQYVKAFPYSKTFEHIIGDKRRISFHVPGIESTVILPERINVTIEGLFLQLSIKKYCFACMTDGHDVLHCSDLNDDAIDFHACRNTHFENLRNSLAVHSEDSHLYGNSDNNSMLITLKMEPSFNVPLNDNMPDIVNSTTAGAAICLVDENMPPVLNPYTNDSFSEISESGLTPQSSQFDSDAVAGCFNNCSVNNIRDDQNKTKMHLLQQNNSEMHQSVAENEKFLNFRQSRNKISNRWSKVFQNSDMGRKYKNFYSSKEYIKYKQKMQIRTKLHRRFKSNETVVPEETKIHKYKGVGVISKPLTNGAPEMTPVAIKLEQNDFNVPPSYDM